MNTTKQRSTRTKKTTRKSPGQICVSPSRKTAKQNSKRGQSPTRTPTQVKKICQVTQWYCPTVPSKTCTTNKLELHPGPSKHGETVHHHFPVQKWQIMTSHFVCTAEALPQIPLTCASKHPPSNQENLSLVTTLTSHSITCLSSDRPPYGERERPKGPL